MTPRYLINVAALAVACTATLAAADTLDIYFIDVEGGQATLIVTPARQSLLVDTGWAGNDGRDAGRIVAAVRAAGLDHLDYLLTTHFHPDHVGGVVELAARVQVRAFIDHGGFAPGTAARSAADLAAYEAYVKVRAKGKHIEPKPGDRLPLKGVDVVFVSSAGQTITRPVRGPSTPTAACTPTVPEAGERVENPRSTGFHLRFGEFRFVDLGDLTGAPLYDLVCPINKLGTVDAYLLPHHGGNDVSHPAFVAAMRPTAAVLNNGATKGGQARTFEMLRAAPGLQDVWQLHRSENANVLNFADERIANLDETTGYWLKLSANANGVFRVTNQRTGSSRTYSRRAP